MSKEELIARLEHIAENHDTEAAHALADAALIEYINDSEIEKAYEAVDKWYAYGDYL